MTRFSDALNRLSQAVRERLSDTRGNYVSPSATYADVPLIIDRAFELYREEQLAERVTTISVLCADIPTSSSADVIETPERSWRVYQILEDDGQLRRLRVG
jgi:hypothetical protein